MKVIKFGGSSLASAEQVNKVIQIIKDDAQRRFVVVSAPGKRSAEDRKVTDLLIDLYQARTTNQETTAIIEAIYQRFVEIAAPFSIKDDVLSDILTSLHDLVTLPIENNPYFLDAVLSAGENNNAKLIASICQASGIQARYINPKELGIIVTNEPQNAHILTKSYKKIYNWRHSEEILIIPGFFGYTEEGQICTFSRGGSDITGAIVARGLRADTYENFTDVNGIYAAHPGYIHEPETITELTYREMRELAYAGFSVFHEEALMPCFQASIPVVIKNTNNPTHPGTQIVTERTNLDKPVVGISSDEGFTMIYLSKYLMNKEVGFTLRILEIFRDFNLNYEHMPSGIDDLSIILRSDQLTEAIEEELLRKIAYEINPDELRITHDLSLVVVVGEGMKQRVGSMAESTAALARKNINLEMINQGSSEVSFMFGIHKEREKDAIRSLYYTFFE
ncbi:aspartokinase [Enterococcus alcedinis]|uniref:Aspartokinase n=1 Tax=Enterococcus alcedinis TaxID=1274384 RepID=A0A917JGZ7_9ENTE|nr:aspartate kinase [Enterococcus alcedinis]MBP2103199.1 aspartate kinase [Enterococcus alcedinis]GGI66763.1 aspartokinase [Enterococcus alcedinis]